MTKSTAEEVEVYDELIAVRPEFSFHIGLTKQFWGDKIGFDAANLNFKTEPSNAERGNSEKTTVRSSLAWLLALARIELLASLSAYTNVKNPFNYLEPSDFDRRQYEVLLFDDALSHMLSLKHDPRFKKVSHPGRMADAESLDYLRRSKVVKDMVKAARRTSLNTPYAEESWDSEYDDVSEMVAELRESINASLQSYNSAWVATSDYESIDACGVLLQAARRGKIKSRVRETYPSSSSNRRR